MFESMKYKYTCILTKSHALNIWNTTCHRVVQNKGGNAIC